jgi:competence protein ComEA
VQYTYRRSELVNINNASEAELTRVRGIGPTRAQRINNERDNRPDHRFTSVDDLKTISGIGDGVLFEQIRPQVTV